MLGDGEEDTSNGDHQEEENPELNWRGCSMAEIYRNLNPFELDHLAAVKPSATHTVLHHFPIRNDEGEPPKPLKCHPKWDAFHVRLPCSSKSQYPVMAEDGSFTIENRWEVIEKALLKPIQNSVDLQAAILSYNTKYEGQWNFRALHYELDENEANELFEDLLPRIIRLALRLPELVQAPIPLLKQGKCHALTLTQEQISCLLANAFLCTYPRRNTLKNKSEYSVFPDINFNSLFQSSGYAVLEKIKCICHYFKRVCPLDDDASNVPIGCVTFERRYKPHNDIPNWAESSIPLGITPLHISSEGTIEDQGLGLLQVDFANKFLGGRVLGSGCVQEEIRFVICPELIVSKLFTECLNPTEALLMVGCERYSNYTGYANSFQWSGNYKDCTPRDSSRRRLCHIVAIDALHFQDSSHQYQEELILRELNKAYVGFSHPLSTLAPGVASGNWGCGAFGGKASLKALLQLMACTVTSRPLVYFTFGDEELRDQVHKMHTFFIENNVMVKDLWLVLRNFQARQWMAAKDLYTYLYSELEEIKRIQPKQPAVINETNKPTTNNAVEKVEIKPTTLNSMTISPRPSTSSLSLEETFFASSSPECENSPMVLTISDDSETDELLQPKQPAVINETNKPTTNNAVEKVEIKPTTLNSMTISPRPSTSSLSLEETFFASSSPECENSPMVLTISDDSETDELLQPKQPAVINETNKPTTNNAVEKVEIKPTTLNSMTISPRPSTSSLSLEETFFASSSPECENSPMVLTISDDSETDELLQPKQPAVINETNKPTTNNAVEKVEIKPTTLNSMTISPRPSTSSLSLEETFFASSSPECENSPMVLTISDDSETDELLQPKQPAVINETNKPTTNNAVEKVEIKPTTLNSMTISPRPSTSSLSLEETFFASSSPECENSPMVLTISDDSETDELLQPKQPAVINETNKPTTNNAVEKVEIKPTTLNSMTISPRPSTSSLSLEETFFASSSPECENSPMVLTISDDSETDELLATVTGEACEQILDIKTAQPDKQSPRLNGGDSPAAITKTRHRTLLEMLDQTYNQAGPATKKYCVNKSPQQKK